MSQPQIQLVALPNANIEVLAAGQLSGPVLENLQTFYHRSNFGRLGADLSGPRLCGLCQDRNRFLLLSDARDAILAVAHLAIVSGVSGDYAVLQDIVTTAWMRNEERNLSKILEGAIDHCQKEEGGLRYLEVVISRTNEDRYDFYRKLGFERCSGEGMYELYRFRL